MKEERKRIYNKYNGKCAYCGCELNGKFQIDHVICQRNFLFHVANKHKVPGFLQHLTLSDINHVDNLMPSCCSCNNYKNTMSLELFRAEIYRQREILRNRSTVRLAERYGIIEFHDKPVIFYFEEYERS